MLNWRCSESHELSGILSAVLTSKSISNSDCLWIAYADVSIVFVIAGLYGYCLFSNCWKELLNKKSFSKDELAKCLILIGQMFNSQLFG